MVSFTAPLWITGHRTVSQNNNQGAFTIGDAMNKQEEIKQLRELAERILNRMDELVLSYDDADEKLAAQRIVNKMNDAVLDMVFLEQ